LEDPVLQATQVLPGMTSARGNAKAAAWSNYTGTAGKVLQRMHARLDHSRLHSFGCLRPQ